MLPAVAQRGRAMSLDEAGVEAMNDVFSWLIQEAPVDTVSLYALETLFQMSKND